MIPFLKDLFLNETKRSILFLVISGISLLISFLEPENAAFDSAWIAIVLCGIPIIIEAVEGLVTRFDIKADVLVSLALIASVIIGEIFADSSDPGNSHELFIIELQNSDDRILDQRDSCIRIPAFQDLDDKLEVFPDDRIPKIKMHFQRIPADKIGSGFQLGPEQPGA